MTQNIILPEHNSSRLLFVDVDVINSGQSELLIENTTTDTNCDCSGDYPYDNCWLLGKLAPKIYLLEDCGVYDSNHLHTANIYYIDPTTNDKVILYNVLREMEYSHECDRLYCEHSGGMKLMIVEPTDQTLQANLYIKYENNFPPAKEEVKSITSDGDITNYIELYKYNNGILSLNDIIAITNKLNISKGDGSSDLMEDINYVNIDIQNVSIDFSKICIDFNIDENNTNNVKIGILGVNTQNKKFISYRYSSDCIEPSYFIIETPNNRSWICLRTCYEDNPYVAYNGRSINEHICGYITRNSEGLTGYYGNYDNENNKYIYEINIDRNKLPFSLLIPTIFNDFESITFKDSEDNIITHSPYTNIGNVYNELDGLSYDVYIINNNVQTSKIILTYNN